MHSFTVFANHEFSGQSQLLGNRTFHGDPVFPTTETAAETHAWEDCHATQNQIAYGDFYRLNAIKLIQAMVMFGLEALHP